MKNLKQLFLLLITLLIISNIANAQYAGIEMYPKGDIFLYAGKDIVPDRIKVDLWATPNSEIAFSVGPKVGPFAFGLGLSMGVPKDKVDLTYINADLGFGFDLGAVHWQSYNLYQAGQNVDDFILARQWLSYNDSPLGIVGHNIKCGADDWQLNWGIYYDFGEISLLSESKFGITADLNGGTPWAVLVLGL